MMAKPVGGLKGSQSTAEMGKLGGVLGFMDKSPAGAKSLLAESL